MNKFRQFANIEWKNIQNAKEAKEMKEELPQPTQMQKVASMLVHIIERKAALPNHHAGLPERLTNDIRDSFKTMDTDGDGLLSRTDLQRLTYKIDPEMTEDEMSDLLDTADLDGDGMYDVDEYLFLVYLKWNDQESVDDIKEAFRVFDRDNSDSLSREEFSYILKRLGEPLTDYEVDEILDHFDRDGSGEIDFDEFAYVMTGPHLDDDSADSTGIPGRVGKKRQTLDQLGQTRRILASPVSRSTSHRKLSSVSVPSLSDETELKAAGSGFLTADVVIERCNLSTHSLNTMNTSKVKPPPKPMRRMSSVLPDLGSAAKLMQRMHISTQSSQK